MKKKIIIFSLFISCLVMICSFGKADTNASYDSQGTVGFTGSYSPPDSGAKDQNNESESLPTNEQEDLQVTGNRIPNAGDSSIKGYILIVGLAMFVSLLLTRKIKKGEVY
ncbi:MAG: hypothetical protein LBH89_06585 [Lactococcus lactis]|nr:hypothetical protein [Lactococcus lactis]